MITSQHCKLKNEVVISPRRNFDYSIHQDFRDAYKEHSAPRIKFVVDLSKVKYIDSSALGMLLLLKEHAQKLGGDARLHHPTDSVAKLIKIANFDTLFHITYTSST